ncbi:MAG TPA: protein kinase, partial [Vicinamibacterales bacterium]|nr:protein kinase [Vicinamibacterales bacterium]
MPCSCAASSLGRRAVKGLIQGLRSRYGLSWPAPVLPAATHAAEGPAAIESIREARTLRNPRRDWGRRNGRGLQGPRHAPEPRRGAQILPPAAGNPDLSRRFQREARAVAVLNHPNICVVHDVGHESGVSPFVMEYLEGETLAARLSRGALPLQQTLQYAVAIADALDKAHRTGVVHRDVKPS